jgi:hypothetical protein
MTTNFFVTGATKMSSKLVKTFIISESFFDQKDSFENAVTEGLQYCHANFPDKEITRVTTVDPYGAIYLKFFVKEENG